MSTSNTESAARRRIAAVEDWGELGTWDFHLCHDPQNLVQELDALVSRK